MEDPEIRQLKLELAAAGKISDETALRPLGIDAKQERKKVLEEQDEIEKEMQERDSEMAKKDANKGFKVRRQHNIEQGITRGRKVPMAQTRRNRLIRERAASLVTGSDAETSNNG